MSFGGPTIFTRPLDPMTVPSFTKETKLRYSRQKIFHMKRGLGLEKSLKSENELNF